jgi:hypothetical protein
MGNVWGLMSWVLFIRERSVIRYFVIALVEWKILIVIISICLGKFISFPTV